MPSRTITIDDDRFAYADKLPGGASKFFRDAVDAHRAANSGNEVSRDANQ